MAVRALFPASLPAREMQSFRYWGRSPDRPPVAKLLMAFLTYLIDIWRGSISSPGVEKGLRSLGASGCLVFKTSSDRRLGGSISSAEEAMRAAPRMLPSSIFEDMRSGRALASFSCKTFGLCEHPVSLSNLFGRRCRLVCLQGWQEKSSAVRTWRGFQADFGHQIAANYRH